MGKFLDGEVGKPWGLGYRLESGKNRDSAVWHALRTVRGYTRSMKEICKEMVKKVIVKDEDENESGWQKEVRERLTVKERELRLGEVESVDEEEVLWAVGKFKKGKAPGLDGVTMEMVVRGWEVIGEEVVGVMNECMNEGLFPKEWKEGELVMLKKGDDRDVQLVSSYRPICLLPVLGKVWERVILERMSGVIENSWDEWQFGCRKGRSVDDALRELGKRVEGSRFKYVMGIFFDIKGAFDHLWWPHLRLRLLELGVSSEIYRIVASYLSERSAVLGVRSCSVRENVERDVRRGRS